MLNFRDLAVKMFAVAMHLSLLAPTFATERCVTPGTGHAGLHPGEAHSFPLGQRHPGEPLRYWSSRR